MKKLLLTTIILFLGLIQIQAQWFVDIDATGNNDGSSWANAFTNLDTALISWDPTQYQEIWVAEGVYKPGDGVDRTKSFLAKTNMFGGFDGTETSRGQRDPKTNLTILSGDLLGNDNNIISATEPTRSDNSYSIIYSSASIAIDGFIIEGGHADASSGSDQSKSGAAMYIFNNGNTIRNCVFRNNYGNEDGAIVKFRGPSSYNSWITMHSNEFYNNVSYRSMISSTRISTLTHTAHIYLYNNLFHHNEVTQNEASIILATTHVNGGSLSMGHYEYLIYHNTFVNNTIPNSGGTIGHGRNDIQNGANDGWCTLYIEVVGNIIWNDAPTLVAKSIVSGSIENSSQFYFAQNVIKGTDSIQNADLLTDLPFIGGNVYNEFPMFEDTTMNNFTISECSAPGNDIVNYLNSGLTITSDFYGNPREVGFTKDAGHCEVQQETSAVSIQQVGATLEATTGFIGYSWILGQAPYTFYNETTNVLSPTDGDGTYLVMVVDSNQCRNSATFNFCGSKTVSIALIGDSLVATGTGTGVAYGWYFNGNYVGGNDTYTPTSPGTYSVSFYEPDGMGGTIGCSASATFEVTCNNEPIALISQNGNLLEVNDVFNNYQWMQNGTNLAGETSATFTPAQDGDYQVAVTGSFGCMQNSAIFSYCSSVNVSVTQNTITLEATTGFVSYQWFLVGGNGTGIAGATSTTFSPTQDGTYYCNASDGNCTGTSNNINFSLTSISAYQENLNLKVYPNPTNGIVNIDTDLEINSIEVFNMNGQLINQIENQKTINLNNAPNGVYILKVTTKKGVSVNRLLKN